MRDSIDTDSYLYELAEYLSGKRGLTEYSHTIKNTERVSDLMAAMENAKNKAAAEVLREFEQKYPDLVKGKKNDHDRKVKELAEYVNDCLTYRR